MVWPQIHGHVPTSIYLYTHTHAHTDRSWSQEAHEESQNCAGLEFTDYLQISPEGPQHKYKWHKTEM